jgi:hypothetical protein
LEKSASILSSPRLLPATNIDVTANRNAIDSRVMIVPLSVGTD